MPHRLLNLLTTLSLLLCATILALWFRNGRRAESLRYNGDRVRLSFISADGSVGVAKWQAPTAAPSPHGRWLYWRTPTPWVMADHPVADRGPRGFAFGKKSDDGFGAEWWLAVPHCLAAAVFGLPALAWGFAHRRRLPGLLSAVSLMTCLILAVLWARSYAGGESWGWSGWKGTRDAAFFSERGELSLYWQPPPVLSDNSLLPPGERYYYATNDPRGRGVRVLSMRSESNTRAFGPHLGLALFLQWPDADGINRLGAMAPYWLFTLATAAPPALWLRARRRRRRRRGPPVCRQCGYDLRATPGRCPECGAPTSHRADVVTP